MEQISRDQLNLLHHTLGINPEQREPYRNYFLASEEHHDIEDLKALVVAGMMQRSNPPSFCGDDGILFACTDDGKRYAIDQLPPPPKRKRYEEYLRSEVCESFADWLGIVSPEYEYLFRKLRMVRKRYVSEGIEIISGEWKYTKKEAKASYKAALLASKAAKIENTRW